MPRPVFAGEDTGNTLLLSRARRTILLSRRLLLSRRCHLPNQNEMGRRGKRGLLSSRVQDREIGQSILQSRLSILLCPNLQFVCCDLILGHSYYLDPLNFPYCLSVLLLDILPFPSFPVIL